MDGATRRIRDVPMVLVIGATKTFLDSCLRACEAAEIVMMPADPAEASTLAARHRPLVMLVLRHVFPLFGEEHFTNLAEAVGARLATLDHERVSQRELDAIVLENVTEARWTRR